MTKQEMMQFLNGVQAMYPHIYNNVDKVTLKYIAGKWYKFVGSFDFKTVDAAFDMYINRGEEYAPTPGQIRQIILNSQHKRKTGDEAWETEVIPGLKNAISAPRAAFEKLSPETQRTLGSYMALRQLAQTNFDDLSFKKTQFINNYNNLASDFVDDDAPQDSRDALTSSEFLKQLAQRTGKQLTGGKLNG